jgi:hypothetical protein
MTSSENPPRRLTDSLNAITTLFAVFWSGWFLWWILGIVGGHYSALLCWQFGATCENANGIGWSLIDFFILMSPLLLAMAIFAVVLEEREKGKGKPLNDFPTISRGTYLVRENQGDRK